MTSDHLFFNLIKFHFESLFLLLCDVTSSGVPYVADSDVTSSGGPYVADSLLLSTTCHYQALYQILKILSQVVPEKYPLYTSYTRSINI